MKGGKAGEARLRGILGGKIGGQGIRPTLFMSLRERQVGAAGEGSAQERPSFVRTKSPTLAPPFSSRVFSASGAGP